MSEKPNQHTSSSSFTILAVFLVIALIIVMLLPLFYLLHCFDELDPKHQHIHFPHNYIDKEHYKPSIRVHDFLNDYNTAFAKNKTKQKTLPVPPKPDYNQCKILNNNERFDCHPETYASAETCEARGCCWMPPSENIGGEKENINVPYCFYPRNYSSYSYINVTATAYGLVGFLKRKFQSTYPGDVEIVKMTVKFETDQRLHVKVGVCLCKNF